MGAATASHSSWIESFLAALSSKGFSDDTAAYTYRAFTGFLPGQLLLDRGWTSGPSRATRIAVPGDEHYQHYRRLGTSLGPWRSNGRARRRRRATPR